MTFQVQAVLSNFQRVSGLFLAPQYTQHQKYSNKQQNECDFIMICLQFLAQNNLTPVTRPRPGSFGNSPSASYASGKTFPTSSSSGSIAPPPSITQRNPNRNLTKTSDTDLISFTIPTENVSNDSLLLTNDSTSLSSSMTATTAATTPGFDSHSNFKQMVDEIHRYRKLLFSIEPRMTKLMIH